MNQTDIISLNYKLQYFSIIFLILCISICSFQCAQPAQPQGGPKDSTPPILDVEKSTPNFQTNFTIQDIELHFNEFIVVKDVFKQVVVSPPLDNLPTVTSRLKKLKFEFPDDQVLKDSATYTINFGSSIRDFTEGNAVKDFRFVFSTGDYIDSLEFNGSVVNAIDGSKAPDVVVMLYDSFEDSIVYKEKPFYFATTDKSGNFKFQNLRSDSFKIFALLDGNLNYIYDSETESIGFSEEIIFISDSITSSINLEIFLPEQDLKILTKDLKQYGRATILFNKNPEDVSLEFLEEEPTYFKTIDKDSLILYYHSEADVQLVVKHVKETLDTINLNFKDRNEFLKEKKLQIVGSNISRGINVPANKSLSIGFNHPIEEMVDTFIQLLDTSQQIVLFDLSHDSVDLRKLSFSSDWKKDEEFQFTILPGAFKDIYGLVNDTILIDVRIKEEFVYGKIILAVDSLDDNYNYVLELLKDGEFEAQRIIERDTSQILTFEKLLPGKYEVKIIEDRNFNNKWDPGNYALKQQSEEIFTKSLGDLLENWEMKETLNWEKE